MSWQEAERRRLVRLCAAITGDHQAAEDLAQETLLEAWRNAHKLTDPAGADRWLAAVARNVCLRWSRRRHRGEVLCADPPEQAFEEWFEFERDGELARRLAALPASAREVLVERYVLERSTREIAARLGISADAVTMRLARCRTALLGGESWRPTRIWCFGCGKRKLEILREHEPRSIAFRCPGCDPGGRVAVFPLGNPVFGALVAGLERPSAMFRRVGAWSLDYYSAGAGAAVACTGCGAEAVVRRHRRRDGAHGLHVRCDACGAEISSSLTGLAAVTPDVVELRRRRPRTRARGERHGRSAIVLRFESPEDGDSVDVAFDRGSLRLLGAA